jgi:hypothetical protein
MKVIASKTIVIKNRYFVGLDIGNSYKASTLVLNACTWSQRR